MVVDAVIATEDKGFFRHGGIDPLGILRATWSDLWGHSLQGGSTLTQQYVKNVYLGKERTFARKVKEASLAVKLERQLTKRQILERYLNTIYLGRGAYGVEAAAQAYFGKDVGELGLRVTTTLDPKAQREARRAIYGLLDRPTDPEGALVAVDDSGYIRAMVGGRDWNVSKVNLAVGAEGGGGGRQAGSTFKPFLLAEIVKEGYSVSSTFAAPKEVTFPRADNGKDYKVTNFDNESFPGELSLVDATKMSVNTVYAQAADAIGSGHLADMARQLGVRADLQPNLSLVLGTPSVSVLDMAAAYGTLARRGDHVDPISILEVATADHRVLYRAHPVRTRVLAPRQADVVTSCLEQVVQSGTGTGAAFGKPLAGKTGTTEDFGDAWFIGYTPRLTAAVWMGYPQGATARRLVNVHGRPGGVEGGSFPATIFRRFMQAVEEGRDDGDFPAVTAFPGRALRPSGRAELPSTTTTSSTVAPGSTSTTQPGSGSTTSTSRGSTTTTTTTAPASTSTTRSSTTTTR